MGDGAGFLWEIVGWDCCRYSFGGLGLGAMGIIICCSCYSEYYYSECRSWNCRFLETASRSLSFYFLEFFKFLDYSIRFSSFSSVLFQVPEKIFLNLLCNRSWISISILSSSDNWPFSYFILVFLGALLIVLWFDVYFYRVPCFYYCCGFYLSGEVRNVW